MSKCPFCLNSINEGATACGSCGAYMSVSSMSNIRRLVFVAWLVLSLFIAWGLWDSYNQVSLFFLVIAAISIIGIVVKPKIIWIKH
jgi:hypothetical protein